MKKRTSLNKIMLICLVIFVIGILSGIIYYLLLNNEEKTNILYEVETITNILVNKKFNIKNIIVLLILYILSISIIGLPIIIFYLFFEGLSIGFLLIPVFVEYSVFGILYYFIYIIFIRLILVSILLYITYISITNTIKIINSIKNNSNESFLKIFRYNIIRFSICIFILIINELLIYYIFNKIVLFFKFLI